MTENREHDFPKLFDLTGMTLTKYRVLEKLGQGGMAQVYKAYQPGLERYVAIKVLHPHLTDDENFVTRFQREARAIATLEHPHIVHVHDFDTNNGVTFIVMECLQGVNLKARLRELACREAILPLEETVAIVGALAAALDYAHAQGVIHRDIKPSNVLMTPDRGPVLTDFSIARMVEATAITDSNSTLGTPAYMSPEQGQGEPGDARSDIYALGILLYQLCTGQVPFDADTPYAVILKHITAPLPSPRSLRPELSEAIERVIYKALAKDPADRYQTAGDLAGAFEAAVKAPGEATIPTQHRRSRLAGGKPAFPVTLRPRRPTLLLIPFLAVALLLGGWFTRSWWLPMITPAAFSLPTESPHTIYLAGPEHVKDSWLNPDMPDDTWYTTDLVHLQGPLTPDRLLFRFDLRALPPATRVVSATLTLHVELWGDEIFPGVAVVYRVLTPWDPETATYNSPWHSPGLSGGIDYDHTPLDLAPVTEAGALCFNVTQAVRVWHESGQPNAGLVVMMSEDSHNMAHWWVAMSEQAEILTHPTLVIAYEAVP
ncbi:MAG: protein kinase [Anaerolineae bacterium]|nr:protein kinase [Anaerolineae bacterium]